MLQRDDTDPRESSSESDPGAVGRPQRASDVCAANLIRGRKGSYRKVGLGDRLTPGLLDADG